MILLLLEHEKSSVHSKLSQNRRISKIALDLALDYLLIDQGMHIFIVIFEQYVV